MAIMEKEHEMKGDTEKPEYSPELTDNVIAATGPKAHPRLKQIMPSLVQHLHAICREVDLTVAELMMGVELINECGRKSTDKRNETLLLSDILGIESLADEITSKLLLSGTSTSDATPSAVLGPFYRADAPLLPNGSSIVSPQTGWYEQAKPLLANVSGRVLSKTTGKPIPDAIVDVWLAGPNGLYEQQDDEQPDMNLRGRFRTDALGRYEIVCLRPTPYPVPLDGPAGRLLGLLDRHPYRPAHIHFIVGAEGYRRLVTQIFDEEDGHVKDDAVFATKDELLVKFERREGDERARWSLVYDFTLGEA
ncbi:aromatic compound dioxygenase [Annulohypoxylon maeteangense]|uniref:aromatic compound dioxygenase n=1 Tax=Annulohypoxylon maeteangense TaxID=1927788 RepID=UPI0020080ED8|nr:aromatic compound dioxygenase [Annulohypoxylon maeteangense]KAI0883413.1 aromatic compound dioxygenase [Annulohypoxylon maeteangense]